MSIKPFASIRCRIFRVNILLLTTLITAMAAGFATAQEQAITTAVSIRQDQLAAGTYSVNEVLQSGRQFFAVPFLPIDGHGEGDTVMGDPANGPRAAQRVDQWFGSTPFPHWIPFLRVNGIDSQSCFECHNSAGTYIPEGQAARTRKPGGLGGGAGFASSLLSSSDFPNPLSHFLRAPPRVFGSAYLQELGLEMTADLLQIEQNAADDAAASPGTPITAPLFAKGIGFGSITITCGDATCNSPIRDTSAVVGVQPDLIVRPFQHKGIAATLRSFVKTALDFHHSMQAVELVGVETDCDGDGVINEMSAQGIGLGFPGSTVSVEQSLGNVAALTAFTGMLRPPNQTPTLGGPDGGHGAQLFDQAGCSGCHTSTLTTRPDPQFRIQFAEPADACPQTHYLGSFAEVDAVVHPAVLAATAAQYPTAGSGGLCSVGFYCIDLTEPVSAPAAPLPDEFYPRLSANTDGTVTVPLYSDLKRHDLGCFLSQKGPQQADDSGNPLPNDEWLTTKLWGVVANSPWIHDGRARTLREAILMHNGPNGTGQPPQCIGPPSEAAASITAFLALTSSDQQAIVGFLEALTIPLPGGD